MGDILIPEEIRGAALAELCKNFEVVCLPNLWRDAGELAVQIKEFRGLIVRNQTLVDSALLDAAEKLVVVGWAGVGLDNVEVEYATRRGILVTSTPDQNAISVAELAICMMISLARRVADANQDTRAGGWNRLKFLGTELYGKTCGILGAGRIGYLTAQRARAFGMKIVAYDPFISRDKREAQDRVTRAVCEDVARVLNGQTALNAVNKLTASTSQQPNITYYRRSRRSVNRKMANHLTPGKRTCLRLISDKRGVVAALALDQRGLLRKAIAREMQVADVSASTVEEFKKLVTQTLTHYASAILLDPEYGLPAAECRNSAGLLLAYERSSYDAAPPRLPFLYDLWSVRRMKKVGANCIKVLLHYTPFEDAAINDVKQAWVERIGDECLANDIPFVLELLGYDIYGNGKSTNYAKTKPEIVARSIEEFSKDHYAVDLLKIEVPVQMGFVAGTRYFSGEQVYTRIEAQQHFLATASATDKPFVYLSAGVTNEQFIETLEFAAESGSRFNGVLCGRAIWQEGIAAFAQNGASELRRWLNTSGRENIMRVNSVLGAAKPWFCQPGFN